MAIKLAILMANSIITKNHLTGDFFIFFAGEVGIEPTTSVLETDVIPFNYAPSSVAIVDVKRKKSS